MPCATSSIPGDRPSARSLRNLPVTPIAGQSCLLHEILMRSGWAQDVDRSNRFNVDEFRPAAQVAECRKVGRWDLGGGLVIESAPQPPVEQLVLRIPNS
jgi:hypothetical protein